MAGGQLREGLRPRGRAVRCREPQPQPCVSGRCRPRRAVPGAAGAPCRRAVPPRFARSGGGGSSKVPRRKVADNFLAFFFANVNVKAN